MRIDYDAWLAEYRPHMYTNYEEAGLGIDYEADEILKTYEAEELEEFGIDEHRVWTWLPDGRIFSGRHAGEYLVTEKPWTQPVDVYEESPA